jgi:signal transduction histidine kinase
MEIVVRDDMDRRVAEAELQETRARLEAQNEELRRTQARLIEIDRVRSEFLGMMSHELRTPVNILIGYTHMLLESVAAGESLPAHERAGILRRMIAGGHTLSELVEDTLSVLRFDAGAVRLDLEPVALDAFFHDLKGNDRLLRGDEQVEERWVVEPDVPAMLTDRRKLRQVITNLVGNARKFTRSGFIEVRASVPAPGRVRISVTDTGCGIAAEDLGRVFELYRQVQNGHAHDGCGIGLYIVRRYVEMLRGQVACASTLGEGSTFSVDLPDRIETATAAARPAARG